MKREIPATVETEERPHNYSTIRKQYIDGEMSDEEFEDRVESALEQGPAIDNSGEIMQSRDWTVRKRLGSLADGLMISPLTYIVDSLADDASLKYSFREHKLDIVDTDPDADDHPAETAGSIRSLLSFAPTFIYGLFSLSAAAGQIAVEPEVVTVRFAIALVCIALMVLSTQAPVLIVKCRDVGIGTFISGGATAE